MNNGSNRDLWEMMQDALEGICKFLVIVGILGTLIGAGFLIYTVIATSANTSLDKAALGNVAILDKFLYAGVCSLAVGTTVLFWGEQTLAILQLIVAAILYTSPLWLSQMSPSTGDAGKQAMASLQNGGVILGGIGICVLIADVLTRTKDRFRGWREGRP